MELVIDDVIEKELIDYLLTQPGILNVKVNLDGFLTKLYIEHDDSITPNIIMKYIMLFKNNDNTILFEFDKGTNGKYKTLKYKIDDICCEYCYKILVMNLFDDFRIKSVKSDFEFNRVVDEVNFLIEYSEDYSEQELIDYIKEKV